MEERKSSASMNNDFIENMPSLHACAKMRSDEVYRTLSHIPSSDYYGVSPIEIAKNVVFNEAVRHLNDLVLLNDLHKSKLYMVSEKSKESGSKFSLSHGEEILSLNNNSIKQISNHHKHG